MEASCLVRRCACPLEERGSSVRPWPRPESLPLGIAARCPDLFLFTMPLNNRHLSSLRYARQTDQPTKLLLLHEGVGAECFVFARRRGGLLLVVPCEVFSSEELKAALDGGYRGTLGPSATISVTQETALEGETREVSIAV